MKVKRCQAAKKKQRTAYKHSQYLSQRSNQLLKTWVKVERSVILLQAEDTSDPKFMAFTFSGVAIGILTDIIPHLILS